ncbi:MAG: hypothetical protein ACLQFR_07340 [Streptosporangiaceae bacterium]
MLVVLTRNRAIGVVGGLLAVLGGAWFGLGAGFVTYVLKQPSIRVGAPIGAGLAGGAAPIRVYLEQVTLFSGLGLLIAVLGGLAIGRFSLLAARDVAADYESDYSGTFPVRQLPMRAVATAANSFPPEEDQYSSADNSTRPSSVPPPALFPESRPPFPDAPTEYGQPPS